MKHVLISCDACGKVVPDKSVRGWWGLVDPKSDLPTFSFAPLTTKTSDKYSGHVCGPECLGKTLHALASSVDVEKAAVAGKKPAYPSVDDIMRSIFTYPSCENIIKKEIKPDDDEEEY
jgi:hypothetical protein